MFFDNKARTPNLNAGYTRYVNRCRGSKNILDATTYKQVVKDYCKMLAERMEQEGTIDLPSGIGSIIAVAIRRKPTYDKNTGKWRSMTVNRGPYAFGYLFSPRREKGYENFRCYGIRANAELYRRMKKKYNDGTLPFYLSNKETYV